MEKAQPPSTTLTIIFELDGMDSTVKKLEI